MSDVIGRAEKLSRVRDALKKRLPLATITTNDDANPATPMIVKAEWSGGRIWKVVRADSISTSIEEFVSRASAVLEKYQASALRDSEQPQ
jgi:hypothetical protein